MQWLILFLLIPMVLVPIVLHFGFAGCGTYIDTSVLPDNSFAKPTGLVGESVSSSEVKLTWNTTPGEMSVFKVRRIEENGTGNPDELSKGKETGAGNFDDKGESVALKPGTTYIYTVVATAPMAGGTSDSEPSDQAFVTTFPAPSVLTGAARSSADSVDLNWTKSDKATKYLLKFRKGGSGAFAPIYTGPDLSFSHTGLAAGNYDYQVIAVVEHGHQMGQSDQDILSDPSPMITVAVGFTSVFTGLPNTRQDNVTGFCIVQRIASTSLFGSGSKVQVTVQGPPAGSSLKLDRVYISHVTTAAGADEFDSLPSGGPGGLTRLWDKDLDGAPKILGGGDSLVLGPVDFAFDKTKDFLIAFDTANEAGQGTLTRNPNAPGATSYAAAATAEAAIADRTQGRYVPTLNNLYLIKLIEVQ